MLDHAFSEQEMKNLLNKMQNDRKNPFALDYWDEKKKDPFEWCVVFIAPEDSIYAGGYFKVKIKLNNYPLSQPSFYFRTKIYHLNINNSSGKACCEVINKKDIRDYLDAIYLMFYFEDDNSTYNYKEIYQKDKNEYKKNVKEWVIKYASLDNFEENKPDEFVD